MSKSIHVVAKDGLHGMASDAGNGQFRVRLDNGQEMLVTRETLTQQQDGSYYLPIGLADLEGKNTQLGEGEDKIVLPIVAETLHVDKEIVSSKVRVTKVVTEHEEVVDEPLLREEVDVQYVTVNKVVDKAEPVRYDGDKMIVPVYEEILVVEKRLVLKEELHITKHTYTEHQPQKGVVREEKVIIERKSSEGKAQSQ